jgi:hypothetical protein
VLLVKIVSALHTAGLLKCQGGGYRARHDYSAPGFRPDQASPGQDAGVRDIMGKMGYDACVKDNIGKMYYSFIREKLYSLLVKRSL